MSYRDQENSAMSGNPFYLYEFKTVDQSWHYTDLPSDMQFNGDTYESFPVSHTDIKQSNEISKNSVTVKIPKKGKFADMFVGWSPDKVITLTIRRGHFGSNDDPLVYWKGRIASQTLKNITIELTCESIFTSMRRPGLRARYQRNCRHAIYSKGCGVKKADFAVSVFIKAASGTDVTVDNVNSMPDGWFNGGIIEFPDNSFRMILSHVGNQLKVTRTSRFALESIRDSGYGKNYGQFYGGGVSAILYPGCDRTLSTCINKFDNVLNQGGFKWIPAKNPMGGSSIT